MCCTVWAVRAVGAEFTGLCMLCSVSCVYCVVFTVYAVGAALCELCVRCFDECTVLQPCNKYFLLSAKWYDWKQTTSPEFRNGERKFKRKNGWCSPSRHQTWLPSASTSCTITQPCRRLHHLLTCMFVCLSQVNITSLSLIISQWLFQLTPTTTGN